MQWDDLPTLEEEIELLRHHLKELEDDADYVKRRLRNCERELAQQRQAECAATKLPSEGRNP